MLIKIKKKEPHQLDKCFQIFYQVDRLNEARLARMSRLRKQMAFKIISENEVKLEVVKRMDNLSSLSAFFNQRTQLQREICKFSAGRDLNLKEKYRLNIKKIKIAGKIEQMQ